MLLDTEPAQLYCVTTGALNRCVRRNTNRFPADFMFELTPPRGANLEMPMSPPAKPRREIGFHAIGKGRDPDPLR